MNSEPTPIGAVRRLRALHARGWSAESIELATGLPANVVTQTLTRFDRIAAQDVARVAAVYDALWDRQPPAGTQPHRMARSWAPPMAWDDDVIDQPGAKPEPGWRRGGEKKHRAADVAEDARFVREHGGYRHASTAEVALRLGMTKDALDHALSRARQADREAV